MAPPWEMSRPEPKRRLRGGLTGNALVTALISAVVSGVISFLVASYQSHDAATQAIASEQAQQVVRLEADANGYYEAAFALRGRCANDRNLCPNAALSDSAYVAEQAAFNADRLNVSDARVDTLAANLENRVGNMLSYVGTDQDSGYVNQMVDTYQQLIARCGQLIQGKK